MNYIKYSYETDLYHHGIKGQKWGVRRYQNEDGSLTPAGEKRYYGAANAAQRDIDSFKGLEKGIYSKNGKMLLSPTDVSNSVKALEIRRDKNKASGDAKRAKDYAKMKAKQEKATLKAEKEKAAVNVDIAKNSATRRVAEDYHRLTDREFSGKYQTTKKTFAKRYQKTNGDTYSLGKRKQAMAIAFLNAMKGKNAIRTVKDIAIATKLSDAEQRQLDKGREYSAALVASSRDIFLSRL